MRLGKLLLIFLKELKMMDLGHNQIEAVPSEIRNLIKLKYLNLSDNKLRELLKKIGN
ncbi:leucine-rich repeat domain-containing protein [Paenibacillus alvei]|uniref:leucine-rich repeat domain-containing protein n=1 Tax=Paenibacillus alvei TaxID=44250 RepID=UPI00398FE6FA